MSCVLIRKRLPFSAIPDAVLQDKNLSLAARLTLGWMLGRPENWQIQIHYMMDQLGLTDKTWPRIRRELIHYGYFTQTRHRDPKDGKFVWVQEVTDAPLYETPSLPQGGMEPIPPKRMDGNRRDAKGEDIPIELKQNNSTTTPSPPAHESSEMLEVVGGIEDLVNAAEHQAKLDGTIIRNRSSWRATVRARLESGGVKPEDSQALEAWRKHQAARSIPPVRKTRAAPDPNRSQKLRAALKGAGIDLPS